MRGGNGNGIEGREREWNKGREQEWDEGKGRNSNRMRGGNSNGKRGNKDNKGPPQTPPPGPEDSRLLGIFLSFLFLAQGTCISWTVSVFFLFFSVLWAHLLDAYECLLVL
jgi:hypothetical protein